MEAQKKPPASNSKIVTNQHLSFTTPKFIQFY
jgi:hypothetical protein